MRETQRRFPGKRVEIRVVEKLRSSPFRLKPSVPGGTLSDPHNRGEAAVWNQRRPAAPETRIAEGQNARFGLATGVGLGFFSGLAVTVGLVLSDRDARSQGNRWSDERPKRLQNILSEAGALC